MLDSKAYQVEDASINVMRCILTTDKQMRQLGTGALTPTALKTEPGLHETPLATRSSRQPSRSPSEGYPRRTRQTRSGVADSPTSSASHGALSSIVTPRTSQRLARSSTLHAVSDKLRRSVTQGSSHSTGGVNSGTTAVPGMPPSNRRDAVDRPLRGGSGFLATPDTSEIAGSILDRSMQRRRSMHLDRPQLLQDPNSLS
jgi:F-box and WD-40 domain protein CDC4